MLKSAPQNGQNFRLNNFVNRLADFFETDRRTLYTRAMTAFALTLVSVPLWLQIYRDRNPVAAVISAIVSFGWMLVLFICLANIMRNQGAKRFGIKLYVFGVSFSLAAFWVLVFYPALMSPDSLNQWEQALTNRYEDWHPLGMTLVMRGVVLLTGWLTLSPNLQAAIFAFVQGSLFWLAIFNTILTFVSSYRLKKILLAVTFLYYPLWAYTVILWKDVWTAIFLLFLIAELYKLIHYQDKKLTRLIICSLMCFAAILSRGNNIVSLAIFFPMVLMLVFVSIGYERKHIFKLAGAILIILVVGVVLNKTVDTVIEQKRYGNFTNMLFAYDVMGTLSFANLPPEKLQQLASYQRYGPERMERGISEYSCEDNMTYLVWAKNPPFPQEVLLDNNAIIQDLPGLITSQPVPYLRHKLCVVDALLQVSRTFYTYHRGIQPNELGLGENSRLPVLHLMLAGWLSFSSRSNNPLSLPYRHGYLLLLTILACGWMLYKFRRIDATSAPPLYLLAVGLAYFLPYLITVPAGDWRYLLFSHIVWLLSLMLALANLRSLSRRTKNLEPEIEPAIKHKAETKPETKIEIPETEGAKELV